MRSHGWVVRGVEKDPAAAEYARDKLGLEVFTGDLADADFEEECFEVITFWHSLEHIHRLRENLSAVRALAKPHSRLLLALPNPASLDARIYKKYWAPYDAPRHLWHFRPQVVEKLLSECGFRPRKTIPLPLDPFYNCLLSEKMAAYRGNILLGALRLPIVSALSFMNGYLHSRQGSSLIYSLEKE